MVTKLWGLILEHYEALNARRIANNVFFKKAAGDPSKSTSMNRIDEMYLYYSRILYGN